MPRIAAGVVRFQEEAFPEKRELYEKLAAGQRPEALFITCSDSRISPNLMTQTEPGELFIVRNAGNIVPPHTVHTGGTTASIEFAVGALGVPHIVVCGHTGCGAMKGAMNPEGLDALPHVRAWLGYSRAAVQVTVEKGASLGEDEKMAMLIQQNVLLQLQHLKTHPYVAARLATNRLQLHGWVYDIGSGEVDAWNEETKSFERVAERYADEVAQHAAAVTAQSH